MYRYAKDILDSLFDEPKKFLNHGTAKFTDTPALLRSHDLASISLCGLRIICSSKRSLFQSRENEAILFRGAGTMCFGGSAISKL